MPKSFQVSDEKHPEKHILVFACNNTTHRLSQMAKVGNWFLQFLRVEQKHFQFCRIYLLRSRGRFLQLNSRWRSPNVLTSI